MQSFLLRQLMPSAGSFMPSWGQQAAKPAFGGLAGGWQTRAQTGTSPGGYPPQQPGFGYPGYQQQRGCTELVGCGAPPHYEYVGGGGNYRVQPQYEYVGHGAGDYNLVRPRWMCWLIPLLLLAGGCAGLLWWCGHPNANPVFDCGEGFEQDWGAEKQNYCCVVANLGCVHLTTERTTALPFQCGWGFGRWELLWSAEKKAYCCQTMDRGCESETSPRPQPWICDDDPTDDPIIGGRVVDNWPAAKKEWCCQKEGKGCPPPERDCEQVFLNWKKDWSRDIRRWCCNACAENVCHARKCRPFARHPYVVARSP